MFDCLIIGGGAAGMSCALILGSAQEKPFVQGKKIGIIAHQRTSHLQNALFNNVLALAPETTGADILENGKKHLAEVYSHIEQIHTEKVMTVKQHNDYFTVTTNKAEHKTKLIVIAVGYTNSFSIKGLEHYIESHKKSKPEKERIQLKNKDHLVAENVYVAGTLAGWRSQFAIACGSGASVATDILTLWNNGGHVKVHDKV